MILTITEIRQQLNMDADEGEDTYLEALGMAAEDYTKSYCNRLILPEGEDLPTETNPDAINITPSLKFAMLLLVGHLNENRESSSPLNLHEIPLGFQSLASAYRIYPQ